jgi:FAD binding domain
VVARPLYSMGVRSTRGGDRTTPIEYNGRATRRLAGILQQGDRHGYEPVHKAHRPGAGGAVPGCRRRGCALDLYAAYLLARRGVEVALLERHPDFERTFRGDGLQPSGIDAFDQMGLGARLRELPRATINMIDIYQEARRRGRGSMPRRRRPVLPPLLRK